MSAEESRKKCNAVKRHEYLSLIRQGHGRQSAARAVGLAPSTLWRYALAHPEFARAIDEAEIEAAEAIQPVLYQKAREGQAWAVNKVLDNRLPHLWQDRRRPATEIHVKPAESLDELRAELLNRLEQLKEET